MNLAASLIAATLLVTTSVAVSASPTQHDSGTVVTQTERVSSTRNTASTPRTQLVRETGALAIDPLLDPALHTRSRGGR
ncbi:MAG: hypothetical protein AAFX39_13790 [Pseudomonadota bacterium]